MKYLLHLCWFVFAVHAQPTNQLQKVFVHSISDHIDTESIAHVQPIKHEISLELSKLVFYFTQEPVLLPTSEKEGLQGKKIVTYLFPKTDISSEAQSMLYKCNNQSSPYYSCIVKMVQKPVQAVEVTIVYDPKHVVYQYDAFEAIGSQKAIVFTFFNKQLLDRLKDMKTSILQTAQANFHKPKIVLDCGHGGSDSGACGEYATVEKEITLSVGKQLAQEITKRGWDVVLTRVEDVFVALDERTAIANKANADMFISLHANFSKNHTASGVETFFFDNNCLKHRSNVNYYSAYCVKQASDNAGARSNLLAQAIHENMLNESKKHRDVLDRKVKRAAAQVLLGSAIPAVLIELGFISNKNEALALKSESYRSALIEGICRGIQSYLTEKVL